MGFFTRKSDDELRKEYEALKQKRAEQEKIKVQKDQRLALEQQVRNERSAVKDLAFKNSALGQISERVKTVANSPGAQRLKAGISTRLNKAVDNYGKNQSKYDPLAMPSEFARSKPKQKKQTNEIDRLLRL